MVHTKSVFFKFQFFWGGDASRQPPPPDPLGYTTGRRKWRIILGNEVQSIGDQLDVLHIAMYVCVCVYIYTR